MGETIINPDIKKTFPWKLAMIFLLFSGVIILLGINYYRYERNRIFEEQEKSLSSIASLKIKQISQWYSDKLADAVVIRDNEPLVSRIKQFLKDENQTVIRKEITIWLEALNKQYDYNSVALLDTLLRVRIATSNADPLADESIRKELNNVIRYHKIIMTDLHKTGTSQAIRMDLLVPLLDSLSKEQKTIGLIILSIDPDKILFPLVQSWPTLSKSSETLILRKEGDSVLYLNELRHRKNTAFNLKFPLSKENLLATKAANGFEGVTEGTDYRNVPVIGALSKIPGLPWYMVAKTDKEEILAPFKRYSVITVLVIILLVLINASIFGFWIWQQRIKFYKNQLKSEISIRELEERFTTAFRMSPVSVTISSVANNKFIDVNNTFLRDMEYAREEVIGRTAKELNIWADDGEREWIINEISEKGKIFGKVISYKTRTGKILYGLSSMAIVKVNGEPCNLSTVVNITDNKKAELKLMESEELYRKLFENMLNGFAYCKMICEDGKPLDFLYLNVNKAFATLTGLKDVVGKRVSEAIPGIQEADPELLERYNRVSSTGIPEVFETYVESLKMWFAISVYSPQTGYFVAVFDVITNRKLAEEALRVSEERYRNIFNSLIEGFCIVEMVFDEKNKPVDYRFLEINTSFEEQTGLHDAKGKLMRELAPDHEAYWFEIYGKVALTGESVRFENEAKALNRWFEVSASRVDDLEGQKVAIYFNDITERKSSEMALRESEDKFKYIFDHSVIGKSITFPSGEINVNKAFCAMLGYSEEELEKTKWQDITHPDDIKWTEKELQYLISGKKESTRFIKRYLHKNGFVIWTDVSTALRRDISGKPLYFMTSIIDITERKLAEEALRDSEERFSKSFRTSPISFMIANMEDGRIIEINDAFTGISGFTREEAIGNTTLNMKIWVHEEDRKHMIDSLRKGKAILHKETMLRAKEGKIAIVLLSAQVIKLANSNCIISSIEDITERKRAEEALRVSEDKFKYIFEHSALGNSITHPNGETHFNNAFCEMLGYSDKELVNMRWQEFTHPDDFEITQKVVDSLVARESDSPRFIKRYLRKDGSVMWADVSTSQRYDKDDKPLYFMTTVNDITDLKLAEEVLRNDEKRFRELIEALPQLYWTCRVDGPCDYLSKQWVEYTGIPEADQLGYRWLEQLHPDDKEKTISEWDEKVITRTSFEFEFRIRRHDGEYHWFKSRAVPIHDADGNIIRWLGSNTDIDSIRRAEDQLRNYNKDLAQSVILRTEQLEAANKELEAFSYSVSHDLRAPLRSVHGYTKILMEEYESMLDEEGKRICGIISSSATQMGELIDDLLSFSRIGRTSMNPSQLDMKSIVKSVFEEICPGTQKSRTNLKIGKLHKVFGDATLLKLVWTNLISNAIKYSSRKNISEISISSELKHNRITYSVEDNGVGFDMKYKHKLFGVFQRLHSEADFEGNGVGLAIVQRIVLKHGGNVWAQGEEGKGATFYFSLPVQDKRHPPDRTKEDLL